MPFSLLSSNQQHSPVTAEIPMLKMLSFHKKPLIFSTFLSRDVNFFLMSFIYFLFTFYNVVLVSAIQQHGSAIIIHVSPPPWASLPSPSPHPRRSPRRARLCSMLYSTFSSTAHFIHDGGYMWMLLPPSLPLTPSPLCPVHSLHLQLHSFLRRDGNLKVYK